MGDGVADTLGQSGVYVDPAWRQQVHLTGLERDLLRCWWVRRLAWVAHAYAAAVVSTQSYSRLEHALGLLALVARFDSDDHLARAAALLHDVGHLPLSHTFEGLAGLEHHTLGRNRITELSEVFAAHQVDVGDVLDVVEGRQASTLRGPTDHLRLDHLESWVRSGHAHGRTREPAADTLARLRLLGGAVDTDRETAAYLVELALGEARWRTSIPNVVASGLVRHLAGTLLDGLEPEGRLRVAAMTDHEFWALLLSHPVTGPTADAFRRDPASWTAAALDQADRPEGSDDAPGCAEDATRSGDVEFDVGRLYLDLSLVDGQPFAAVDPRVAGLSASSHRYLIRPVDPSARR